MARGAAQAGRKQRPKEPPKKRKRAAPAYEQTMFFPRLRRQAKWVFVFLALVFAVGFVAFGVGSGSSGISDILRGNFFGGGGTSTSSLVKQKQQAIARNPKDISAYLDLAGLYQQDQDETKALATLSKAEQVAPKNFDVLNRIAGIYSGQAELERQAAQNAQIVYFESTVSPPGLDPSSTLGQAISSDPYSDVLKTRANEAYSKMVERLHEGRDRLQEARDRGCRDLAGGERPTPAGRGRTDLRRHDHGRQRLHALPEDRARQSQRPRCPTNPRAAQGVSPAEPALDSARGNEAGMNFDIKTEELGDDAYVISLAGEVDLYTAPEFKQQLLDVIAKGAKSVVVDFSNTTFIDSTTLGVLVGGVKRLRANEGQLSLVCSDRNITKIFEITGLDRVFTIYPTRDEAIAKTSSPGQPST